MIERNEHLEWSKSRAREYLDAGDGPTAVSSIMSDMSKHPQLSPTVPLLASLALLAAMNGVDEARKFIEGIN